MILAESLLLLLAWHENNVAVAWAAFFVGFPGFILWRMMFSSKSWMMGVSFLLSLGAALTIVAYVVLSTVPDVESTVFYPFTLTSFALVTVCGLDARVSERWVWLSAGFVVANMSLFVAAYSAQSVFIPDFRFVIAFIAVGVAITVTPRLLAVNTKRQIDLDKSSDFVEQEDAFIQATQVATATLHDTLLANLSLISQMKPGVLQPEARDELEAQLAQLHTDDWLINTASLPSQSQTRSQDYDDELTNVIAQAQASGLRVHRSGELESLTKLSPESIDALVGALAQCLTNVEKHSGQNSVEVVVLAAGEFVSVTVIDTGNGFVPDEVPEDRMGIRLSVTARINSVGGKVRIWSNPDSGTAVMMQVPLAGVQ